MAPRKVKPRTPEEDARIRSAHTTRKKFEAGNPGRFQTVPTLGSEKPADAYKRLGFSDDAIHPMGQQELPGMEHPDIVPQRRWEEMHPEEQKRAVRGAATFGVTMASAARSFGAQLDQAHLRAAGHGTEPYSMRFYSESEPRGDVHTPRSRVIASAKENGVSLSTQVVANAITSPKQVFDRTPKSGPNKGQRIYPNDMNATGAIQHAQAGLPHEDARSVPGAGGLHGNNQRAAFAVAQMMSGVRNEDLKNPGGKPVLGPKTGPYHNSWVDPHGPSQFLVSDIHTGGGGFAPHLSLQHETRKDAEGNTRRVVTTSATGEEMTRARYDLSPREKYLDVPGIHQMHDYIARQELAKRGLHSVSGAQAAQWGEERINRGLIKDSEAYPAPKVRPQHPGQGTLF